MAANIEHWLQAGRSSGVHTDHEYFVSLKLSAKQLRRLNRCRVHLQVLFLSNIASTDGSFIMKCYKKGKRDPYRQSSLDWPYQPTPPWQDWTLWENTLHHLETGVKLTTALGNWCSPSHQNWHSFYDPVTLELFLEYPTGWTKHLPIIRSSRHLTRSAAKPWFSMTTFSTAAPTTQVLHPASIILDSLSDDTIFQISVSSTPKPSAAEASESDHILYEGDSPSPVPHRYYREIL